MRTYTKSDLKRLGFRFQPRSGYQITYVHIPSWRGTHDSGDTYTVAVYNGGSQFSVSFRSRILAVWPVRGTGPATIRTAMDDWRSNLRWVVFEDPLYADMVAHALSYAKEAAR